MELIAAVITIFPSFFDSSMIKGIILSGVIGASIVGYYKYIPNKLKITGNLSELESKLRQLEKKIDDKSNYLELEIKNRVTKQELNDYLMDVKKEFKEFRYSFDAIRDKLHFLLVKSGVDLEQIL